MALFPCFSPWCFKMHQLRRLLLNIQYPMWRKTSFWALTIQQQCLHTQFKLLNSIREDQKLAEADQRLNIVWPRHRLSGAARRRFEKVMAQEFLYAKARQQIGKPKMYTQNKRPRSDDILSTDIAKMAKTGTPFEPSRVEINYRETVVGIRVRSTDFPEIHVSNKQLASVKAVKLDRVLKKVRTIQPSYSGCTFQLGYLVFSCKDEATDACGSEMLEETWFFGSDSFLIPRSGLERKLVLKIILWSGSLLVWKNIVGLCWGRGSVVQVLASLSPTVPKLQSFNLRFMPLCSTQGKTWPRSSLAK